MARPRTSPMTAPPRPNSEPMATIRPPRPASRTTVFMVLRNIAPSLARTVDLGTSIEAVRRALAGWTQDERPALEGQPGSG